ncbi:MAG: hypothetical protein ACK5Q7_16095 [Cyanobacteriota bacterium]
MPIPVSMVVRRTSSLGLALLGWLVWGFGVGVVPTLAAPAPSAPPSTTASFGEAMEPSTADQLALVEHLRRVGVVFYGAWWCPACFKQKNLFGQQAGNQLPYMECDKTDEQRQLCQQASIGAYPTWVMGKERLEGVQTLERLSQWSGFSRPLAPAASQAVNN